MNVLTMLIIQIRKISVLCGIQPQIIGATGKGHLIIARLKISEARKRKSRHYETDQSTMQP